MAVHLQDAAEAYAAVALLVVGADGLGTLQERDFLFGQLGQAEVFAGLTPESLGGLLGQVTGRMFISVSDDGSPVNEDVIDDICATVRDLLDADQCHELFGLAVDVAHSDGLDGTERTVLAALAKGMRIDFLTAQRLIDRDAD